MEMTKTNLTTKSFAPSFCSQKIQPKSPNQPNHSTTQTKPSKPSNQILFCFCVVLNQIIGGGPTLHPPILHEDNSTQKLDTERLYTRAALHQITLHEKQ